MSNTTLELTDASGNEITTQKNSLSNESEEENHFIKQETTSSKLYLFMKRYFKQFKLVFQSIIPDFKSFKYWQMIILILYSTFNLIFSVLDFNSFFSQEQNRTLIKWTNDLHDGVPLWRRILLCLSGLSAVTTVLNVVLVIHGKMSSYFWGITGAILYGSFAFAFGYVGDAQLFVFVFLPAQFVGIHIWSKQLDNQSTTRVKSLTFTGWCLTLLLSFILIVFFYYEIPMFSKYLTSIYLFETRFIPHILDAITNGLSVIGEVLLIACYWEQYIIWTFVNLMLIVMYSGFLETTRDINLLLVWIMLTCNSSCGLYTWYHRWKSRKIPLSTINRKV